MDFAGCSSSINASGFAKKLSRERFWKRGFWKAVCIKTFKWKSYFYKRRGRQFCLIKLVFEERSFLKRDFETHANQVQNSFWILLVFVTKAFGRQVLNTVENILTHQNFAKQVLMPFGKAILLYAMFFWRKRQLWE